MKYDFTSILNRKGMDAAAVDGVGLAKGLAPDAPKEGFEPIPMWVADMNFPTCPTIQDSIIARVKEPHFGYFLPRREYFEGIIKWQGVRNGVTGLKPEHIGYENGVKGGIWTALRVLCSQGDNILIHSPIYKGFYVSLLKDGYHLIYSDLVQDENGVYRMDYTDMEEKIVKNNIHCMLLCSPHNPTGRVWERWELEKAMEICKKHEVFVISDEIWSDIIRPGNKFIPTQSISEDARSRTIALYAPTKTFNLAGLVGSYHIIYNKWLRDRMTREAALNHYNEMNVLSMYALIGAYQPEGYEWADELCQTIAGNVDFACDYIKEKFEGVKVTKPEGTYMLFLDCTDWCAAHGKTIDQLIKAGWDVGVDWQDGREFRGPCHVRMNLALPLTRVQEAFDRLDKYVFNA